MDANSSPWTTESSREIYANPWIRVTEDEVVRPDGGTGIYGVVTMQHPSVFVVALTDADEVLMVSLHRYPTNAPSLEVPAGGCDDDEPLVAARRELWEETGYTAHTWEHIGSMNALNGVCNAPEHVFLARGLTRSPAATAATDGERRTEGIQSVLHVPWADLMQRVARGEITDGETVAALMYAALACGKL